MTLRTLLNWHKNQELIFKKKLKILLRLSDLHLYSFIQMFYVLKFLTHPQPICQSMKVGRFICLPRIAGLSIRRTLSVWELKLVTLAAVESLWASAENIGPDTYPEITCNREMSCKFTYLVKRKDSEKHAKFNMPWVLNTLLNKSKMW